MKFNSKSFGKHINKRRNYYNQSMDELSKELGISKATISRVERGNKPDIDTAIILSHWYGVGIEFFIEQELKTKL